MTAYASSPKLNDSLGAMLLATCPDSIIVTDGSGLITEWNPAAEKAFVCPRHEALGNSFLDFLFATSSTESQAQDPTSTSIETIATRSDGSTFPCTVTIANLRGAAKILYVRELKVPISDSADANGARVSSEALPGEPIRELLDLTELAENAVAEVVSPRTIVVVDDCPDIRDYLSSALTLDGRFDVLPFACGSEAVAYLENTGAALVLLDMELGSEKGDEIARRLRELEHHKTTPILAMTGHPGSEYRERSQAAGCNDHLVKPLTHERIVAVIDEQLSAQSGGPLVGRTSDDRVQSRIEELIPDFLASQKNQADRIAELIDTPWPGADQLREVRDLGHQLKGCGTTFGFEPISHLGGRIESAAEDCDQQELQSLTRELRHYLEQALADTSEAPVKALPGAMLES